MLDNRIVNVIKMSYLSIHNSVQAAKTTSEQFEYTSYNEKEQGEEMTQQTELCEPHKHTRIHSGAPEI